MSKTIEDLHKENKRLRTEILNLRKEIEEGLETMKLVPMRYRELVARQLKGLDNLLRWLSAKPGRYATADECENLVLLTIPGRTIATGANTGVLDSVYHLQKNADRVIGAQAAIVDKDLETAFSHAVESLHNEL